MKLIVNGEPLDVETTGTLSTVIATLGYEGDWLATAVNGELVHVADRGDYRLNENDRIEVLSPMQGG